MYLNTQSFHSCKRVWPPLAIPFQKWIIHVHEHGTILEIFYPCLLLLFFSKPTGRSLLSCKLSGGFCSLSIPCGQNSSSHPCWQSQDSQCSEVVMFLLGMSFMSRMFLLDRKPSDSGWDSTDFHTEFNKLIVMIPNWPSGVTCQGQ